MGRERPGPGLAAVLACAAALLALVIVAVPLAGLAHQSLNTSSGSVPVWVVAPFGVVGLVVAWRRPANPLGWIMLGGAFFGALSEDASFYTVADYRLRHGGLPLGWVAPWPRPPCSTRCVTGCSGWWTGASTGLATTP